jgi:hypothetical protein
VKASHDARYQEFRRITLAELGSENGVWEVFGDTLNWFPDDDVETRASDAERLLRELWTDGYARFVRSPSASSDDPDAVELTDGAIEELIQSGIWRAQPVPEEAIHVILVTTPKARHWRESQEWRNEPHAPAS